MWFRVELHKDGSVASCAEAEASFKNTKQVFYVEADTKEKALARVVTLYQREKERIRRTKSDRVASGRCPDCPNRLDAAFGYCSACREKRRLACERRRRFGSVAPEPRPLHERALNLRERRARGNATYAAKVRELYDTDPTTLAALRKILKQCLAAYRANPRGHEAWLVAKLKSIGVDVKNEKPSTYEAAAE